MKKQPTVLSFGGIGIIGLVFSMVAMAFSSGLRGADSSDAPPSRFPSEIAQPVFEKGVRVLHRDDFTKDTIGRLWGAASRDTKIEDGVLKIRSEGKGQGKVKVKVVPFVDAALRFRFQHVDTKSFGFGFDDLTATEGSHGYDGDIGYTKTGHIGYTYMFISIGDVVVQSKYIRCG